MKFKLLIKDIIVSTCLLGAAAGVVFGISAGTFKIRYMDLDNAQNRLNANKSNNYRSQQIKSDWNMYDVKDADGNITLPGLTMPTKRQMNTLQDWKSWHSQADSCPFADFIGSNQMELDKDEGENISNSAINKRWSTTTMVIDGATHTTMDRSFNQSLYEGLVDFNKNKSCLSYDAETETDPVNKNTAHSYKPTQDNTTDFINTYVSVINKHDIIGLAGFNHTTPLSSMMTHKKLSDGSLDPQATCANDATTKDAEKSAFILLDANLANNQNVASVQFRADQPGFMTALATCDYFINNLNLYHNKHQNISVAMFGGVAIPTVTIYMGGFQRGVELFNNAILENVVTNGAHKWFDPSFDDDGIYAQALETFKKLLEYSKYKNQIEDIKNDSSLTPEQKNNKYLSNVKQNLKKEYTVRVIKLGNTATHFSGTFASGDAIGLTKQYLNRGASAIIAVAGPQSLDAAQEIKNQNSKCIVIGVDTAMEDSDYQRYHKGCDKSSKQKINDKDWLVDKMAAPDGSHSQQANSIIKFSAVKDIKSVSKKITRLATTGQNWDVSDNTGTKPDPYRAICGPGFQTCCNIQNGLVSISWDGFYPMLQALENLPFSIPNQDQPSPFSEVWKYAINEYKTILGSDWDAIDAEYRGNGSTTGIYDVANVETFKRYDDNGNPTVFYKNYHHTTGIIGMLLKHGILTFTPEVTLIPVDETQENPQEFKIMPEGETRKYSIITWLDYNMYLSC